MLHHVGELVILRILPELNTDKDTLYSPKAQSKSAFLTYFFYGWCSDFIHV